MSIEQANLIESLRLENSFLTRQVETLEKTLEERLEEIFMLRMERKMNEMTTYSMREVIGILDKYVSGEDEILKLTIDKAREMFA